MKLSYISLFASVLSFSFAAPSPSPEGVAALLEPALTYESDTAKRDAGTKVKVVRATTKTVTPASLQSQMLYYHNAWRAHHAATPLTWNTTLAAAALKSASKCVFAHTTNNRYGENIAAGTYTNPAFYAAMWYNEVSLYNYNKPGFTEATGHFTQVVWRGSKQLGCAWVKCPGTFPWYLFCEYFPAGNVLPASNFASNVLRAKAAPKNPPQPPGNL
ncbi:Pseudecin [Arthrobotrys entomopaga]|nr:Pseudecin [Arthrobotrys entomopaga]